jgi:cytoskeletal protein RodZ
MPENNIEKNFGFILKEARANKHIGLEEASKHTRIHINILKAIENDDVASLGAVYVKSFLRLYADYLGVDKDDVLRRFRQATGQPEAGDSRKVETSERHPRHHLNLDNIFLKNSKFFIIGVLLFIAIALIVRFVKSHRAKPRSAQVSAQRATQAVIKKAEVEKAAPVAPVSQPAEKPAAVKKEPISTPPAEKIQKKIVLVVRAKDKCWLQVKVDGKVVFQNVLAKGSSESWQAYDKIELWLGNAGAVQFELNGRLLQKIGRPGQILRHVVVTRAGLSIRG